MLITDAIVTIIYSDVHIDRHVGKILFHSPNVVHTSFSSASSKVEILQFHNRKRQGLLQPFLLDIVSCFLVDIKVVYRFVHPPRQFCPRKCSRKNHFFYISENAFKRLAGVCPFLCLRLVRWRLLWTDLCYHDANKVFIVVLLVQIYNTCPLLFWRVWIVMHRTVILYWNNVLSSSDFRSRDGALTACHFQVVCLKTEYLRLVTISFQNVKLPVPPVKSKIQVMASLSI